MSRIIRIGNGSIFRQYDADENQDLIATVDADDLEIPVTHAIVKKTTGADAEALSLPNGKPSQVLHIRLATDGGGDGTLTPVTSDEFETIVFADAGDTAVLLYVNDTIGWIILGLHGVAGPPAFTVPTP